MSEQNSKKQNIVLDVLESFAALPVWVQFWMFGWLVPVNMASFLFITEPMGIWIVVLANLGLILNTPVLIYDRGFSKLMAVPHIPAWTAVIGLIVFARPDASGVYDHYLTILAITNTISLLFDYPDAIKWLRGDRAVAGKEIS